MWSVNVCPKTREAGAGSGFNTAEGVILSVFDVKASVDCSRLAVAEIIFQFFDDGIQRLNCFATVAWLPLVDYTRVAKENYPNYFVKWCPARRVG